MHRLCLLRAQKSLAILAAAISALLSALVELCCIDPFLANLVHSLTQLIMSYSYYPSSSSGSVEHVRRPAGDDGRGSFGPVLVVLAVISFLSVAACVAGRVCSRGSSSTGGKSSTGQHGDEDAEKAGFGAAQLAVMTPVPSSRATVHDAFEIKLLPPNNPPAGGRQFMAAAPASAAGAASFRGPPSGNGGVVRPAHHPPVRNGLAFNPTQLRK